MNNIVDTFCKDRKISRIVQEIRQNIEFFLDKACVCAGKAVPLHRFLKPCDGELSMNEPLNLE